MHVNWIALHERCGWSSEVSGKYTNMTMGMLVRRFQFGKVAAEMFPHVREALLIALSRSACAGPGCAKSVFAG